METREILLVVISVSFAAAAGNALWFGFELRRFANSTPVLASSSDLARFKTVVAHQMKAALAQIGLLATPAAVFAYGLVGEHLIGTDLLFIVVPSAIIVVLAVTFRSWEVRVRSIAAANPELAAQRDEIVKIWRSKPLPNW